MHYTYRCQLCQLTVASFEDLTEHKRLELEAIAQIQRTNPEWSLQECFAYFRLAPTSAPTGVLGENLSPASLS